MDIKVVSGRNGMMAQPYIIAVCMAGMVLIVLFAVSEVLGVGAVVLAGMVWLKWRGNWH